MRPSVFDDLELRAAFDRAVAEHKLLLVDATAEWCGPCKMMDRTTWNDPAVIEWLREHAVTIQIDVDKQQDVARPLRIEAMPTIIAFVEGAEFDRVVGAKKPKELLAWLDGVLRGETSLVVQKRRVAAEPADMRARLDVARELMSGGRYDEALVEHVWLWDHMLEHQPSLVGVRMSYFASDLERLVNVHPPARVAIGELRDRAAPAAAGSIEIRSFRDWNCLNGVLGEKSRTLAWYDALPVATRSRLGPLLESDVIPLLVEAGRWVDAGALYDAPITALEDAADMVAGTTSRGLPPELIQQLHDRLRATAAQLVRALIAADRGADAVSVEARAREIDPSAEMASVLGTAHGVVKA
jgi:thioredoxin 1